MWEIVKIVSKGDYNYAVVPNHPNATNKGYVLHHRVVVENEIERLLIKGEIVHHKDEDKKNNDISNLEITTVAEHNRYHKYKGKVAHLNCAECKIDFTRAWRNRPEVKGNANSFCSRKCSGTFNRRQSLASIA